MFGYKTHVSIDRKHGFVRRFTVALTFSRDRGPDARCLKALDEKNRKLKSLLADAMLDVATLCEALGKTSDARRTENSRELGH